MSIDIKLTEEIQNVDSTHRFGQILCNALGITCPELYYMTDGQLNTKIKEYHDTFMKITSGEK